MSELTNIKRFLVKKIEFEKEIEVVICSNSKRESLNFKEFAYVYIPLSEEEKEIFQTTIINPCWRIKVPNTFASVKSLT